MATLDNLNTLINTHIQNGTLTLTLADFTNAGFDTSVLAPIFNTYLPNGLLITSVVASENLTRSSITFSGTGGVNTPLNTMTLLGAFVLAGNVVSLGLAGTAPATWNFGVSFPAVANTFLPDLQFQGTHGLYLATGDMTLEDGTVLTQGLSFSGNLMLVEALAQCAWLLGNGETVAIAGPIEVAQTLPPTESSTVYQTVPNMTLTAPVFSGVTLGYFATAPITFEVSSSLAQPSFNNLVPAPEAVMIFRTAIRFQTQTVNLNVPLSAEFYYESDTILQFAANLTDLIYLGFDELSSWVSALSQSAGMGSLNLSVLIPNGLTLSDVIGVANLVLQIDLAADSLSQSFLQFVLGIKSARPWVILTDPTFGTIFSINNIWVSLLVRTPLTSPQLGGAVFGDLNITNDGQVLLSAVYSSGFAVMGQLAPNANINLTQLVQYFIGNSQPDVPAIKVTKLAFRAQPSSGAYAAAITVENEWPISLGSTQLLIQEVSFSIDTQGSADATEARVAGVVLIGSATVALDWAMPGDLLLTGTIPSIQLTEIIQSLSPWQLPAGFPNFTLLNSTIYIQMAGDDGYYLAAGTTVANFGTFEIDFSEVGGQTAFTFGFRLVPNWQLKQLSSVFDSTLFNALYFTDAYLIVSSNNNPNFQFRALPGNTLNQSQPIRGVQAGVMFYTSLTLNPSALESSPLYFVAQLLNGHSLNIGLQIPSNYQDTVFTAALGQGFALAKSSSGTPILQLTALSLTIKPFRLYVDLHLEVLFNIQNTLLGLSGDLVLNGATAEVLLATTTPWIEPFGIQGLTLDRLAVGVKLTAAGTGSITLAGQVTLGTGTSTVTLAAAAEITLAAEEPVPVPDVLLVSEVGAVKLSAIVAAFVGTRNTPSVLQEIELFQFTFFIVANPLGWDNSLDGKHYSPGIAFSGQMRFYGLVAAFAVQVSYSTGISASGQFSAPITIGGIATLANATNPALGPFVSLDSAQAPYLNMSVSLKFFEISTIQLTATINSNAFYLSFNYTLTGLTAFGQLSVETYLRNGNEFSLSANARLDVNNVGPIKVGRYSLGTIPTNIRLAANFAIGVGPGSTLTLVVGGAFSLGGYNMTLSGISLSVTTLSLRSFADLPGFFVQALKDNLWSIGQDLFGSASALFNYVKSGALRLTDDIGNILKDYLHLDINAAAQYLKSIAAMMGYDVTKIGKLLKSGFNAVDTAVASALRSAAYAVEEVATAIGNVFKKDAEAVANVLKSVGYELADVAQALKNVFGYSAKQVANLFKSAWKIADTVVCDALYAANYAKDKVEDAMKSVFNWGKKQLQKAWDTLNPKNW